MRKNVGEVMFHELRQLAARQCRSTQVYVRNFQGRNCLDQYYLLRGGKLVRKSAHLEIPSPAHRLIMRFMPRQYALLRGDV